MADKPNQTPAATPNPPLSKKDAVVDSLQMLGKTAKPLAIRDDIKTRHNMDVDREYISKLKAELLGKKGKKPAAKPAAATKQTTAAKPAAPKEAANGSDDAYLFEDLRTVKGLVDRIGVEQVRKLLGLFAK